MGVLKAKVGGQWVPVEDVGGEGGGGTGVSESYTFVQASPLAVWTINHPLTFRPNVTVVDSSGEQVEGDVDYLSGTTVTITFSSAFAGTAYLS